MRAAAVALVAGVLALSACDRNAPSNAPAPKTDASPSSSSAVTPPGSAGPGTSASPRIDAPPRTEPATPQNAAQPALPSEQNAQGRSGAASERVDPGREPKPQAPGKSSAVDDGTLTDEVRAALAAHDQVPTSGIEVRSRHGRVTLSGRVENRAQKERAAEIARGVAGVQSVENRLTEGS